MVHIKKKIFKKKEKKIQIVVAVLSVSHVWLFATPMDCNLQSFSVHGIFQARILEWVATFFSRSIVANHI